MKIFILIIFMFVSYISHAADEQTKEMRRIDLPKGECCRYCKRGVSEPCGKTCIAKGYTCHKKLSVNPCACYDDERPEDRPDPCAARIKEGFEAGIQEGIKQERERQAGEKNSRLQRWFQNFFDDQNSR